MEKDYTLERQYSRNGFELNLYHVPHFKKVYMLTVKFPGDREGDARVGFFDNFYLAHKTFMEYKKAGG